MDDEREAKQIAAKRLQLMREQSVRSQEDDPRRDWSSSPSKFQELNIVLKGDVDGSVELCPIHFRSSC